MSMAAIKVITSGSSVGAGAERKDVNNDRTCVS